MISPALVKYSVETIDWTPAGVVMIDQTRLPRENRLRHLPQLRRSRRRDPDHGHSRRSGHRRRRRDGCRDRRLAGSGRSEAEMPAICETLAGTRPTAVNLFWAIDRMKRLYASLRGQPLDEIRARLVREAQQIQRGRHRHQPGHRPQRRAAGARRQDGADALQRGRAGHGRIRHGARRDPRGRGGRQTDRRLRR